VKKALKEYKVLIVDDEPDLREIFSSELGNTGFTVFEASSGQEAQAIAERETLDLIVSDIRMPDGDGISLLKWIRSTGTFKGHFIIMSGFTETFEPELKLLKPDRVLNKPVNLRYLCDYVTKILTEGP